jgi:flagellin-like hook-associated protein FlgL
MTEADGWVIETGSNANVVIKGESASTQYKGLRISNGAGANLFIENLNITTSDDENIINFTGAGNTLTLIGTNTLKNTNAGADSAVIHAGASTELTVFGNGTLTVESAANGAAIGGNKEESGGTITINSGTINATGDLGSAIGGGYQGGGGNITVNDGTIKAAAGGGGAAIGGGAYGSAGTIKITGGVISGDSTASYGSIIGSGDSGSGGTIEISGTAQIGESGNAINTVGVTSTNAAIGGNGVAVTIKDNAKVYAESQGYGAAIGGENGKEGDVTISGGTVEATAEGTGAAIGGGYQASGGEITISGGDVTATADYSAAIGGGNEGDGGKITVNGGTIKAVVGSGNAAIGGGYDGGAGTIVISGGVISGDSMSAQGSIIGSGQDGSGGTIEISGTAKIGSNTKALTTNGNAAAIGGDTVEIIIKGNAEVYAESQYYGAAIGGSSGKAGDVTIEGGTINAKASNQGAAIGGGRYANGGEITISGGDVTATASAESAAIGGGGSNDWRYTAGAGGNVTIGGTAKVEASHTGGNAAIGGGINSADSSLDGAGSVLAVSGGLLEVTRGTIGTATNPGTNTITEGNIVVPDGTFVADPTNGTNPVYKVEVTGLPMTVGGNLTVPKSGGNYSGIVAEGKKFYMYVPEANEGQEVTFIATNGDEYKATFAADITGGGTKLTFAKVPGDDPSPGPGPSPGRVIPTGVSMTVTTEGKGVGKQFVEKSGGLVLQIGANGVEDQKLTISIGNMSCAGLGIEDVSVDTQENASDSIDIVDDAVKKISLQRASLGALQNRLEHTANNLLTSHENLTAAESQIRDTDMAAEMIKYTTSNILKQAAQSMLAQANQAPQSVLQLLG